MFANTPTSRSSTLLLATECFNGVVEIIWDVALLVDLVGIETPPVQWISGM